MTTWVADGHHGPHLTAQAGPQAQPTAAEDYDDAECNQMVNDWLTKLLDEDSRRNSLVDANAVPPLTSGHLDHNDNNNTKPPMWPEYYQLPENPCSTHVLSEAFRASMHIGHVNPPGIRSHDSGYGISPTNTGGHVVGPSGEHFTAISQKTSVPYSTPPVSMSGPDARMAAQQNPKLRPICKSRHCDPGPGQPNQPCPVPTGDRGHLRPVSSIVTRPGCSVGGSGHDLPALPPPEYIRNMPPPPAAVNNAPKPAFPASQQGGGYRPVTRSWNVKRAGGGQMASKPRMYKTNSSWVKVPIVPSLQQPQHICPTVPVTPQALMAAVTAMDPRARHPPAPPGPGAELHLRIEQVIEFFKRLERDRKSTEAEMVRLFPDKKMTTSKINFQNFPRLPSNPSRVDRVICDNMREHARVTLLIKKMERLAVKAGASSNSTRSSKHMATWKEAVELVQLRRSQEMYVTDKSDKDHILPLAQAIAQLSGSIKRARTVLWCVFQSTVAALKNV